MKTNRIFEQRFELFLASFVRSGREFAGSQIHLGVGRAAPLSDPNPFGFKYFLKQ